MKLTIAPVAVSGVLAGAAAMAWYLTRSHDDREYLTPGHRRLLDGYVEGC